MEQYMYEDEYRGKWRKLLIVYSAGSDEYRVFQESQLLGLIRYVNEEADFCGWKTEYNVLKPIVAKIGAHIERCVQQQ